MTVIKLNSSDYNALIIAKSENSVSIPEKADKKILKQAEKLESGKESLENFTKDEATKVASYLSSKETNASKPIALWEDDGVISDTDYAMSEELKKNIDQDHNGTITTKEFASALVMGKVTFGKTQGPKLFKTEEEKNYAQKYLDGLSNFAFDPVRSVEDKFINLKPVRLDALNGEYKHPQINESVGDIDLVNFDPVVTNIDYDNDGKNTMTEYFTALEKGDISVFDQFKNIKNHGDLMSAIRTSLSIDPEVIEVLGENPTTEELDAYIDQNFETIMQEFGGNFPYEGYVSMVGDVNAYDTLAKGFGVCSDIHAAITSMRNAHGQEAYMVWTSGLDYSHVFTIYKEKDNTWNIQNYDIIVDTDAKTLTELYDKFMPQHRTMKVFDVSKDGSVKTLSAEHMTATGLKEHRFRSESGIGGYNPWFTPDGLKASNNEISYAKNGGFLGVNPSDNTLSAAKYEKSTHNGKDKIQGSAVEGQYYTNSSGFEYKHLDLKHEVEKKYSGSDKQTYGREHFSVHGGIEQNATELYWQNYSGSDEASDVNPKEAAVRVGFSYERNDSKLIGKSPVKLEIGHQTKLATTVSVDPENPFETRAPKYIGRVQSDSALESKAVTGVFIQPDKNFTARAGMATGLDLMNIDGYKNIGEQFTNIFEADLYADITYARGPVAINAIGLLPVDNLNSSTGSQYKVGLGMAIAPTKHFVLGSTYIHEKIINDNIDYLSVGAEINPTKNIAFGGSFTTPLVGDNTNGVTGDIYGTINFGKKKAIQSSTKEDNNP